MTDPKPRPDVAAILEGAGVNLDAVAQRRELALTVTATVLGAAQAVIDHRGEPGAMARCVTLRAALDELRAHDPASAVVIAAALWADRPERPSAPERMVDLQDALDNLPAPTSTELDALANPAVAAAVDRHGWAGPGTLEDAIESGAYTGQRQSVHDVLGADYLD